MKKIFFYALLLSFVNIGMHAQDWPNLARYQSENEALPTPSPEENRVVFMGNSITELWKITNPEFFTSSYINRGISGQTTPQMLIRFKQDVVALNPKVVVILGGTNDIAGNTGPSTQQMIQDNLSSMAEIATANNIKVVMCSILPAYEFPWRPDIDPKEKIILLNQWIKKYAEQNNHIYIDFYSILVNSWKAMFPEYTGDGVHPNLAGYKLMEPLVIEGINKALNVDGTKVKTTQSVIHILSMKGQLVINYPHKTKVDIFNLESRLVKTVPIVTGINCIPLENGIYLVCIENTCHKVFIK